MKPVLALDIGGTKIAGGIIDQQGNILLADKVSTPTSQGGPAILEQATALLKSLQIQYDGSPMAIGISTGGQIDRFGRIVGGTSMIPNWVGFPFRERVAERFGLPTAMLNDGHAAALAESRFGAGRGYDSMLCIVIGTGLGGGLVINSAVQHGAHGLTGSIGQLKVSADGKTYQPLESWVSGPGLVTAYNQRAATKQLATSGFDVATRARNGDPIAEQVISEMGCWLGLGLSHALHVYDADCVVIGGSVAEIGAPLIETALNSLRQYGHLSVGQIPLLAAQFGSEAGLVGAAVYATQTA